LADVVEVKKGSRSTAHWSNDFIRLNRWLRNSFAQLITPLDMDSIGQNWEDSNRCRKHEGGRVSSMVSETISLKMKVVEAGFVRLQRRRQPRCPYRRRQIIRGLTATTSLTFAAPNPTGGWSPYADRTCPMRALIPSGRSDPQLRVCQAGRSAVSSEQYKSLRTQLKRVTTYKVRARGRLRIILNALGHGFDVFEISMVIVIE